ncbi:MAG: AAC(3) family N-acetyltransferase [Cyclobacteriaceae bacterium]|jgi:aminoglycoside N3'-acetyltransferase|nr:AAC(3) family N-acetyltransferase [Cyclobacteriaceae bacterium]
MKKYDSHILLKSIDDLPFENDDAVFIHSSLLSFGLPVGRTLHHLTDDLIEVIKRKVFTKGSIIVPAFNFDFFETRYFNLQRTPSKGMGTISETVRLHEGSFRSPHPIQSLASIGCKAEYFTQCLTKTAFEEGSSFDLIARNGGKILLLGATFRYISFIHFVEQKLNVPYRYYKSYDGIFEDEFRGIKENRTYNFFARKNEISRKVNPIPLRTEMLKLGLLSEVQVGEGLVCLMQISDFLDIATRYINADPYFLIGDN